MECSHAVLTLMLLVPCNQPGGEATGALAAADRETRAAIRAAAVSEPAADPIAETEPAPTGKPAVPRRRLPVSEAGVTN